jgi:Family of unknown function (DUF5908)
MTLVIKEIHINTIVEDKAQGTLGADQKNNLKGAISSAEKQKIIENCVEEVLRILEERQER